MTIKGRLYVGISTVKRWADLFALIALVTLTFDLLTSK